MVAHALRLIREKLKKEKIVQVKLLDGTVKQVEHYELTKASLGYLVDLLVSLDLPFHDGFISEEAKATDVYNSSEPSRKDF
jgi:hypothetical protein